MKITEKLCLWGGALRRCRVDPIGSDSYNEMMKSSLMKPIWLAFGAALILSACATKNTGNSKLRTSNNPNRPMTLGSENNAVAKENPILLEEEYEAQQRGEVPSFDIDVVRNDQVEQWMAYFQGKGRKWFHLWLERSGRYVPLMRKK